MRVTTVAALISILLQLAACSECRLGAAHFIASFKFYCSCDTGFRLGTLYSCLGTHVDVVQTTERRG